MVRFGDLAVEAVVLEDGTGVMCSANWPPPSARTNRAGQPTQNLCCPMSPRCSGGLAGKRLQHPSASGQTTAFFPAGVISEVASGVIDAALEGRVCIRKRQHLAPNCQRILKALAKTGEVALIDEATGYQYHRAPMHCRL